MKQLALASIIVLLTSIASSPFEKPQNVTVKCPIVADGKANRRARRKS